jgi:hypothetical protein
VVGYKIQFVRHRVCHRRLEAGDGRHGNARLLAFSFSGLLSFGPVLMLEGLRCASQRSPDKAMLGM